MTSTGFVPSWKTWKSHGFLNGYFQALEKKLNPKSFGKLREICYIHMFILRSLIKRINIYLHFCFFNQTIVSHSFVSFKVYTCVYIKISQNVTRAVFNFKGMPFFSTTVIF